MWVAKRRDRYWMEERVLNETTGTSKIVSVSMKKNTPSARKDAEIRLRAKINESNPSNMRLSHLFSKYLAEQKKSLKMSTITRNEITYRTLVEELDNPLLDKITAGYIRECLISTGKSVTTINEYIARLKPALKWGYRNDYISDFSVIEKLIPIRDDKSHREKIKDKFLDKDEISTLLNGMGNTRWALVTKFMVLSGLRFGEVAALNDSDVDDFIHVSKTLDPIHKIITTPKTLDSLRNVFVQPELQECINQIREEMINQKSIFGYSNSFLFSGPDGERIDYFAFNKYLKENALKLLGKKNISTHILRHTHVSLLAEQRVPFDVIARRLGHHDSRVTKDVYFHVTKDLIKKDNETMENITLL